MNYSAAFETAFWLSAFAAPWGALLIFRRLSFFGDALSHSSVAGIAIVLLFIGENPFWLSVGALASVLVTSGLLYWFEKRTRLPSDVALTVSYSGLFAIGLLIMGGDHVHLDHLLLGDIWSVQPNFLWFLRVWGPLVLCVLVWKWRALWVSVIDAQFAEGLGYKSRHLDLLFLTITSVSVVGVIQSVGVVLVAAYFVLPGACVLPWAKSLRALVSGAFLAALVSGFIGLAVSSYCNWAPGPSIATTGFAILILSHFVRRLAD